MFGNAQYIRTSARSALLLGNIMKGGLAPFIYSAQCSIVHSIGELFLKILEGKKYLKKANPI